jgi:hypothetical protein
MSQVIYPVSLRRLARVKGQTYDNAADQQHLPAAAEGSEPSELTQSAIAWNSTSNQLRVKTSTTAWADIPAGDSLGLSVEQRAFRSNLAQVAGAALTSGTAYFVYVGRVPSTITPAHVIFHVTTAGSGAQTAEVGLFSSPLAPNRGAQSLTKLVSTGTVSDLTGTGAAANTAAFTTAIPAGTHLWAGIRTAMASTQPVLWSLGADMNQGAVLSTAASGVLTGAGPFAGALITPAVTVQAPNLMVTLD